MRIAKTKAYLENGLMKVNYVDVDSRCFIKMYYDPAATQSMSEHGIDVVAEMDKAAEKELEQKREQE